MVTVKEDLDILRGESKTASVLDSINTNIRLLAVNNAGNSTEQLIKRKQVITIPVGSKAGTVKRRKNFDLITVLNSKDDKIIAKENEFRKLEETKSNATNDHLNSISTGISELVDIGKNNLVLSENASDSSRAKLSSVGKSKDSSSGGILGLLSSAFSFVPFKSIIGKIGKFLKFDKLSGFVTKLTTKFSGTKIAKRLSGITGKVGKFFRFDKLSSVIGGLTKKFGGKGLAAGFKKVGGVALKGFSEIKAAFDFANTFADNAEVASLAGKKIKDINFSDRISASFSSVIAGFSLGLVSKKGAFGFVKRITDSITDLTASILEMLGFDSVRKKMSKLGSFLEKGVKGGIKALSDSIDFLFDPNSGIFSFVTKGIVSLMDSFDSGGIMGLLKGIPDALFAVVKSIGSSVLSVITGISNKVGILFSKGLKFLDAKFDGLPSRLIKGVTEFINPIVDFATQIPLKIIKEVTKLSKDFSISNLVDSIINVAKFVANIPLNLVKGALGTISDKIVGLFGDNKLTQFIASGAKALSNNITGFKENKLTGPEIKTSKPSLGIKDNTSLSKARFNESVKQKDNIIIKEQQTVINNVQAPPEIVRRTESPDITLSILNVGLSDGI